MGYVGNAPYNGIVNEGNIADNAVTTSKIAPDTVVAADIAAGAVGLSELSATGTPSSSTYLRGDNSWASIASSQWTTSGSNIYYNTGNVGIGVSSPNNLLDIRGASSPQITLNNTSASANDTTDATLATYGGSTPYWSRLNYNASQHIWKTYNTERMRIDSSGNVGIGTSSPASTLHLSSTLPILTFTDTDDSATTRVYQDNAAFVIEVDGTDTKASSSLKFQVDNTVRMNIDSAGRVTTPSQPAFMAYKTSNQTISTTANTKVTYEATEYNIGGHYSTSTSRFTAPVAGIYLFTAVFNPYNISSGNYFTLVGYVNGGAYRSLFRIVSTNDTDYSVTGTFTVSLAANEYVEIYSVSNDGGYGLSAGGYWNSFSGYLLG